MRLYHFVRLEYGLDDIRRRRLKIAEVPDLNDPFELLAPTLGDPFDRRQFAEWRGKFSRAFGMLCFSRDWRSPAQWSHYADSHKGLCLGFDVADESVIRVNYSPRRLNAVAALGTDDEAGADAEMNLILSTKYTHWEYEAEMRVFASLDERDPETGLCFRDFSADLDLKEVIVGHRCELSRDELARALGDLADAVSVCKARPAFNSFTMVRQKDRSLW